MSGYEVEEVQGVAPPPKARVDDAVAAPARERDYLSGFLAQKPRDDAPGEPGGALYEAVVDALKEIYDPEIPVDIYELGLVYAVDIGDDGTAKVEMTLTTPSCPSAQELPAMVEEAVRAGPIGTATTVGIVLDPPWDPWRMSADTKLALHMYVGSNLGA